MRDKFKIYDPSTWIKNVGYPCVAIVSPDGETIYNGRNPQEYFDVFDAKQYADHSVWLYFAEFRFVVLGTLESLNYNFPVVECKIIYEEK